MVITPFMKIIERRNERYIWVFTTGKIYKVSEKYYEVINSLKESKGLLSINIDKNIKSDLINARILIESIEAEVQKLLQELDNSFLKSRELSLTILATENCNFRCVYCYEKFENNLISEDVINSILKFISKEIKRRKLQKIDIVWFGGEPLLAINRIKLFSQRLTELIKNKNIIYTGHMSTNGYLLKEKTANILINKFNIKNFQITVDGPKEIHDKYRPLKNGKGTYDIIIKNLKTLRDSNLKFHIFIRINYDRSSIYKIMDWLPDFLENFRNDERFSLYPHEIFGQSNVCMSPKIPFDMIKLALSYNLGNKLSSLYYKFNFCYAARPDSLVIMPDGSLRKCTVALYDKENFVGHINKNGDLVLNENFNKWVNLYKQVPEKCKICTIFPICMGINCPLVRLTSDSTLPCPPSLFNINFSFENILNEKGGERHGTH